jgi:hypothetical protein
MKKVSRRWLLGGAVAAAAAATYEYLNLGQDTQQVPSHPDHVSDQIREWINKGSVIPRDMLTLRFGDQFPVYSEKLSRFHQLDKPVRFLWCDQLGQLPSDVQIGFRQANYDRNTANITVYTTNRETGETLKEPVCVIANGYRRTNNLPTETKGIYDSLGRAAGHELCHALGVNNDLICPYRISQYTFSKGLDLRLVLGPKIYDFLSNSKSEKLTRVLQQPFQDIHDRDFQQFREIISDQELPPYIDSLMVASTKFLGNVPQSKDQFISVLQSLPNPPFLDDPDARVFGTRILGSLTILINNFGLDDESTRAFLGQILPDMYAEMRGRYGERHPTQALGLPGADPEPAREFSYYFNPSHPRPAGFSWKKSAENVDGEFATGLMANALRLGVQDAAVALVQVHESALSQNRGILLSLVGKEKVDATFDSSALRKKLDLNSGGASPLAPVRQQIEPIRH